MNSGFVTVVIPAYRCESVIASAIESVLGQTYGKFELVVVDDGSPDQTAETIKKYGDKVNYIFQENGGVSKARNTGILNAKGDYIAFLDADDVWEKNKLELQLELFNRHPEVNMVFCGFWNTINGKILKDKYYKDAFNFFKEYRYDYKDIFDSIFKYKINREEFTCYFGYIYKYLFLGNFILPSSVIMKKSSVLNTGLFNENLRVTEETEYFLKYSVKNIIGFIDYPLVRYEMPGSGNLSGKSNMESLMKNALRIQIDSFISNYNSNQINKKYYYKGISKTYSRMAYYYLSEYKLSESRKYAYYSLRFYYLNKMAYIVILGSCFPKIVMEYIAKFKRRRTRNAD